MAAQPISESTKVETRAILEESKEGVGCATDDQILRGPKRWYPRGIPATDARSTVCDAFEFIGGHTPYGATHIMGIRCV